MPHSATPRTTAGFSGAGSSPVTPVYTVVTPVRSRSILVAYGFNGWTSSRDTVSSSSRPVRVPTAPTPLAACSPTTVDRTGSSRRRRRFVSGPTTNRTPRSAEMARAGPERSPPPPGLQRRRSPRPRSRWSRCPKRPKKPGPVDDHGISTSRSRTNRMTPPHGGPPARITPIHQPVPVVRRTARRTFHRPWTRHCSRSRRHWPNWPGRSAIATAHRTSRPPPFIPRWPCRGNPPSAALWRDVPA